MVESSTTRLVVDTGPDFRYQMLRENVQSLDAVLFTHSHKDHMAGLDDIRAFNYFSGKSIDVYADPATEEAVRRDFYYAFSENKYPGLPQLHMRTITPGPFMVGDISIEPIPVWHLMMPVLGFRFGKFTYITDANRIDPESMDKIRGTEVLVLNALRKEKHISHFTLDEATGVAKELRVSKAYFTHLSHQMGLHAAVEPGLPAGMHIASDQMVIEMPPSA